MISVGPSAAAGTGTILPGDFARSRHPRYSYAALAGRGSTLPLDSIALVQRVVGATLGRVSGYGNVEVLGLLRQLPLVDVLLRPPRNEAGLAENNELQGNVLAAFNKDHAAFLLLAFGDGDRAREWIAEVEPQIAGSASVESFNARFSARRRELGADPADLSAEWLGLGFTFAGLKAVSTSPRRLAREVREQFPAFCEGAVRRAPGLGDTGPSAPAGWAFGGPGTPAVHAVLTAVADRKAELDARVRELRRTLKRHDIEIVYEQLGATLPGRRAGHEHFGFKDGISQPGVRGFHPRDPQHPDRRRGHPDEHLIAPGEFVLGYEDEAGSFVWRPEWMLDGSFQVFRRLEQDVAGFREQIQQGADFDPPVDADVLAAKVLGRWPSGVPLVRAPDADPGAESSLVASNRFDFRDDPDGVVTPRFSHIRKSWPRDSAPGGPRSHRIVRRGIPFGAPYEPGGGRGHGARAHRGLVFVCFCASLEQQFEFVQRRWVMDAEFPKRGDGPDPVLGNGGTNALHGHGATKKLRFKPFVTTTGAVYAFSPSRWALRAIAAGRI
jgi:Dyp-type peroxidase family